MLTYLAAPYTHTDPKVRQFRFEQATAAASELIMAGHIVYSPISHTHYMTVGHDLPGSWDFWYLHCVTFLRISSRMVVLMLPGWEQSVGVTAELNVAETLRIPVEYMRQGVLNFGEEE